MFEPLGDSLKKITRGAGIAMVGMAIGLLLQFVARPVIARYGLETNYGIFSLALAILSMFTMLACLGLNHGATRYIAYFRAREEVAKVRGTISASLQLSTAAGLLIGIILFFFAERISVNIFHTPDLVLALKIFAVGIPFFTLINILTSIFRGFDEVKPQVYFYYILLNSLFLLLLFAVILSGLPFVAAFYAYLAALILTFIATITYTTKKLPQRLTFVDRKTPISIRKELLNFSLPILAATMSAMIITWTDTLMLGSLKTPEAVGLYNAAYPLAQFISTPLNAMILIYIPIATGLFSRNEMSQLRATYAISTRWIVFMTLPVFLILFLFPETVLSLFFGAAYVSAAAALRILSFGFMLTNLLGTNGAALVAMGHSKFIMWASLATATLNIALNVLLIPSLGIVGAAVASVASLTLINTIVSVKLYLLCRAQPFSKNLLKPAIVCIVLAFLIQALAHHFLTITWWLLVILFIVYLGIYGLATLFTRSFEKEDIALLLEIEKRSGLNTAFIKKILNRFVQL